MIAISGITAVSASTLTYCEKSTSRKAVDPAANQLRETRPKCDRKAAAADVCLSSATANAVRPELSTKYIAVNASSGHTSESACADCPNSGPTPDIVKNSCAPHQNAIAGAVPLKIIRRHTQARPYDITMLSIAIVTVAGAGPNSSAEVM